MSDAEPLIVTRETFPYGLRCMDCDARLLPGMPYSTRLVGIDPDGVFRTEIVCCPCGLREPVR